ncbi:S1C family serine protease [Geodermatophilus poikilotrophus]|uniref:Putative serine protease PepD n=1 Tax=Geodermatophilus poikilotrophus TaxID=1333667 RepID=A0A1I0EXW3_9ACTN|nr:trypsin-like peptidase domain-containing protein [Geodermatophilus poikilotrophus]SET49546.1 putative serine protease PepD [Geodermatophilus poikilotrophus]
MDPYGTPHSASGNWAPPTWPQQPAGGRAAPGQQATGSAAPGSPLPGQPPFGQPGQHGQPGPVPAAPPAPSRPAGRWRIGVAGLLAGALIGGGAGAGVALLADGPDGSTGGGTAAAQNVTITNPQTATAVTAAAAKAAPSVVTVYVTGASGSGSGSGVVLSEDGYVLTNNHVISLDGAGSAVVSVRTSDGTLYDATVVGTQPVYDLAVLELQGASGLTPATFADSDAVQVGDLAVAIGAPLGLSDTVTDGIVSATGRAVATGSTEGDATVIDALQTDAAINPGNSGGALVDGAGEVVGINTAIATVASGAPGQSTESGSIGVGFAIPGNTAKRIAQELVADGSAEITYLGVSAQTAADPDHPEVGTGAQLVQVQPGTPASDAGLQSDDVITAVGDRVVTTSTELTAAVRSAAPGDEVTLTVRRGQQSEQVDVTLGATEG